MLISSIRTWICAALLAVSIGTIVHAQAAKPAAKPYPFDTCIVSGEKLGSMGTPEVLIQDGQEVKFCCSNCLADFKKEPGPFMKKIADAKAPASQPAAK